MFKELADYLTDNIDEITRRWVEGLRQSKRTEVHKHMLTADIVDGMKAMLSNLALIIASRTPPDSETLPLYIISGTDSSALVPEQSQQSPRPRGTRPLVGPFMAAQQTAASHGRLRQNQEYELHEVVIEYIMLRQVIWDLLRVYTNENNVILPSELVQYIDRLVDEMLLTTLENFYSSAVRDLEKRAIHDPLTQLYNKDYFRQRLNEELRRAVRYSEPLAMAMIDMDNLKPINDTYGHPVGDAVINAVAGIIRNSSRQPDVPCRYGGDEFAVILPETNRAQARLMAERVLNNLQNVSVVVTQSGQAIGTGGLRALADASGGAAATTNLPLVISVPTVSIGIASFPEDARNPEMLIAKADAALYQAKRLGRNRIFGSGDPIPHRTQAPVEDAEPPRDQP
jgi:diguanylate cyclase (GGDEF)-like protein